MISLSGEKKAFYDDTRTPLWKRLPFSQPLSLSIETSSVCNLKCKYCAQTLGKDFELHYFRREIMSWDTFLCIVEQLKEFEEPIKKIHLFRNGEPLLNPALPRMIEVLKKEHLCESININSNGLLLTESLSNDLISAGLDSLCISLQGLTPEKCKEMCHVPINMTALRQSLSYFYSHRKQCQLNIKIIDIALDSSEERELFFNQFSPISDRIFIETACAVYEDVDYHGMLRESGLTRHGEQVENPEICQLAFYYLHILANGDLHPCSSVKFPLPVVNLRDCSIKSFWNGNSRQDFLRLQAEKRRNENSICKHCLRLEQEMRVEDNLDQYSSQILKALNEYGGTYERNNQ